MRADEPINVKIMGERNSGTNFLRAAIVDNFDVHPLQDVNATNGWQSFILSRRGLPPALVPILREFFAEQRHRSHMAATGGWKHALISPAFVEKFVEPQACQVFCAVRHPVAWAHSMHQNPFHAYGQVPKDFDTFLTTPWKPRPRDGLGKALLASPLLLWQKKVQSYVEFAAIHPNIHVVKYEDLLLDPQTVFPRIASILGPAKQTLRLPERRMRQFVSHELSTNDYREKVASTRFANLTKSQIRIFSSHLADDLIQKFGYL